MNKIKTRNNYKLSNYKLEDVLCRVHLFLHEGMTLNYKTLTDYLDIPYLRSTDSKKAQLKQLAKIMDLKKDGSKYYINKIYFEVKENKELSKQAQIIENLLMILLSNQENYSLTLTRKQWWLYLGIINQSYMDYLYGLPDHKKNFAENMAFKLNEDVETDKLLQHIDYFYEKTYQKFFRFFNDILIEINDQGGFTVHKTFIVREKGELTVRESTMQEHGFILTKQLQARKKLDLISNFKKVYVQKHLLEQYYNVSEELVRTESNINNYYTAIKICHAHPKVIKEVFSLSTFTELLQKSNTEAINRMQKSILNTYKKKNLSNTDNENVTDIYTQVLDNEQIFPNFLLNQQYLIDKLILTSYLNPQEFIKKYPKAEWMISKDYINTEVF